MVRSPSAGAPLMIICSHFGIYPNTYQGKYKLRTFRTYFEKVYKFNFVTYLCFNNKSLFISILFLINSLMSAFTAFARLIIKGFSRINESFNLFSV